MDWQTDGQKKWHIEVGALPKKFNWITKFSIWYKMNTLPKKLNNPNTSAKTYWSILKSFYKGTKIPIIPPILVNNKIVSDFTEKANTFNDSALPSIKNYTKKIIFLK